MKAFSLLLAVASLALVAGCGGDDDTASTGASGATGASSGGDADAKAAARNAQAAIEVYATDHNGSYAGASPQDLAQIEPSVPVGDLQVDSTDNSYTVSVLAASGATYSVDGELGGAPEYTCEPTGTGDCPDSGDWG